MQYVVMIALSVGIFIALYFIFKKVNPWKDWTFTEEDSTPRRRVVDPALDISDDERAREIQFLNSLWEEANPRERD